MATSRVRGAIPQTAGRTEVMRSEEGEKALAVSYIGRRVSAAAVKGLLQLLEVGKKPRHRSRGGGARRARQPILFSVRQGRNIIRRGVALLD